MACGGPSQDYAYERADAAYAEIMLLLKEKYQAERPHLVKGTMFGREVCIGAQNQREWDEQCAKLRELLRDIVWNADASSW